jgi:hypothetical protein
MSEFGGDTVGKKPGLSIWRIEALKPVEWVDHGKFCVGDSYIVLKTTAKPGKSSFEWDIHFWLGSETTQDEMGVAAYKTVELDDLLGGGPVQHREVQGSESDKFLSYFRGGVEYVAGGVESGFTKVERDVYDTRLLKCKGKRSVRVTSVPVSATSMNSGDVFILDCGLTIYHWNGKDANRKEKAKGLDVTTAIRNDERGGRAKVIVMDEGDESDEFWTALGGKGDVAPGADDDEASEKAAVESQKLVRVSDASGELKVEEIATGELKKDMLDTNDVFIVDSGDIFVWVGKGASADERKNSMIVASKYLAQAGKPATTKVTRVVEMSETSLFKDKFKGWKDLRPVVDFSQDSRMRSIAPGIAKVKQTSAADLDAVALLSMQSNPADTMVDDGTGELEVNRVNNFELEPIPKDLYGQFYAGDSYVIKYTYMQGTKECYIIYFWQGRNSTQDEIGASALLAMKMDDDLNGAATQVRVVQGKEPLHFLCLFKGMMVIHMGGTASGFKNKDDADSYDTDGVNLFHIKGTSPENTRAVQVEEQAKCLNSGDAFLLRTPDTVFAWLGKGCNDAEIGSALKIGELLKTSTVFRTVTEVKEGEEDDKFWGFLGGKDEYANEKVLVEAPRDPRLFQCSNATGKYTVEEIYDFAQDDLDINDVFILDVYSELYVWVGSGANSTEEKESMIMAEKFLEANGSSADTPIVKVRQGSEPPMFTMAFLGWDASAADVFEDPYEKKLRLLNEAKAADDDDAPAPAKPKPASTDGPMKDPATVNYTLKELQDKTAEGVDPKVRELYLSDEDFKTHFKMTKADFAKEKGWKQKSIKQKLKLF